MDQLKLAVELDLPVVLHLRNSLLEGLDILDEIVPRNTNLHFHCFNDNYSLARNIISKFPMAKLGVTGLINYNSSKSLREVVKKMPLKHLLLGKEFDRTIDLYSTGHRMRLLNI